MLRVCERRVTRASDACECVTASVVCARVHSPRGVRQTRGRLAFGTTHLLRVSYLLTSPAPAPAPAPAPVPAPAVTGYSCVLSLTRCSFVKNYAKTGGGAIECFASLYMTSVTFEYNVAHVSGGAVEVFRSKLPGTGIVRCTGCRFVGNVAQTQDAGALLSGGGPSQLSFHTHHHHHHHQDVAWHGTAWHGTARHGTAASLASDSARSPPTSLASRGAGVSLVRCLQCLPPLGTVTQVSPWRARRLWCGWVLLPAYNNAYHSGVCLDIWLLP